jgi:hypothetical protein
MDDYASRRVLRGILMQIIYFSHRTIATMIEIELLSLGIVSKKDLPQEPIFASPRRN